MAATEGPDLEYIKKSGVGKVMAQALGNMYRAQPKFPIDYLAKWLDNYCYQRSFETQMDQKDRATLDLHMQHINDLNDAKERENIEAGRREKEAHRMADVRQKIEENDDHERLVTSFLPTEIFNTVDLTGVYVGYYTHTKPQHLDDQIDGADDTAQGSGYALQYVGGDVKSLVLIFHEGIA